MSSLVDYKVRIIDGYDATAAKHLVLIVSSDGKENWAHRRRLGEHHRGLVIVLVDGIDLLPAAPEVRSSRNVAEPAWASLPADRHGIARGSFPKPTLQMPGTRALRHTPRSKAPGGRRVHSPVVSVSVARVCEARETCLKGHAVARNAMAAPGPGSLSLPLGCALRYWLSP